MITSSIIVSSTAQIDGRLSVVERHETHTGAVINMVYKAPAGAVIQNILSENAKAIDRDLKRFEIEDLIQKFENKQDVGAIGLEYNSRRVLLKAIIRRFLTAQPEDALNMADVMRALPDAQINIDFPEKLIKIKRRLGRLGNMSLIVSNDKVDVEAST